jgi:Tol biopolymer transport system component
MKGRRATIPFLLVIGLVIAACGGRNESTITFTRYTGTSGNVFAMNADGSNERQVTSANGVQAHSTLTPDGATVVYSQVNANNSSIMSVPQAGGTPTELNRGSDWSLVPNVSPDGARIAFTSDVDGNYEIYTMTIDGSDVQQLTFTDPPIQHVGPKYSPDGLLILYATDEDEIDPANEQDIWVMPTNGGAATRLTNTINDRESRGWSPDGMQIVTQTVVNGVGQLLILNADGSGLRQITDFAANTPMFSPGGIFPNMAGAVTPAWSPNGDWIALASNHVGNYEIYRIRPDGSALTRLTQTPEAELSVSWGPLTTTRTS